jgi:hypothetical protein
LTKNQQKTKQKKIYKIYVPLLPYLLLQLHKVENTTATKYNAQKIRFTGLGPQAITKTKKQKHPLTFFFVSFFFHRKETKKKRNDRKIMIIKQENLPTTTRIRENP